MRGDGSETDQLLDGDEILTCTFATMDMLRRAVAAELGEDDGDAYGLAPKPELKVVTPDRDEE